MKSLISFNLLLFLLLNYNLNLNAQDNEHCFGSITDEEKNLEFCSFDKDADAVVLFDIGSTRFEPYKGRIILIYDRTCRIKILKESGIDKAVFTIPFYNYCRISENIIKLEGISWNNINGDLIPEKLDKVNYHDDFKLPFMITRRVEMPEVRKGTIIEFHYIIRSNFLLLLREWDFQADIPTLYSSYELKLSHNYKYKYLMQGEKELINYMEIFEPGHDISLYGDGINRKVHRFTMTNIPAFRESDFIASKENYLSKISFQIAECKNAQGEPIEIFSTWPKLISERLKNKTFGKYVRDAESQARRIINLDSINELDDLGKLNSVMKFIKKTYRWNEIRGSNAMGSVRNFLNNKSGNDGDINLLGIGLLKAAGLDAFPVILSTRGNGMINYDYPFLQFFNYVVIGVRIDGRTFLADGTEPLLTSFSLPERCINGKGLVVKDGEITWLDLSKCELSKVKYSIITDLSGDGLVCMSSVSKVSDGYQSCHIKNKFGEDKVKFIEDLNSKKYIVNEADVIFKDYHSYSAPFSIDFTATYNNDISGKDILIAPFLNEALKINPLKDSIRTIPVDFIYPVGFDFESTIQIPEGFTVTYLPASINIDNESLSLSYNSKVDENHIKTIASYSFKNGIYPATQYSTLKLFMDIIIEKLNDKIVITKQ